MNIWKRLSSVQLRSVQQIKYNIKYRKWNKNEMDEIQCKFKKKYAWEFILKHSYVIKFYEKFTQGK